MTTLGIDPGARHTGWAVTHDGTLHDHGRYTIDTSADWKRGSTRMVEQFAHLLTEMQPDLVVVESTEMSGRGDQGRSESAVFSMAVNTQRTEELAGRLLLAAQSAGAATARVHPARGLSALGLKRGCTDGTVSKAFTLLTGRKLLAKDHHEARALGVALAGEKQWRLEQAKQGRLTA